MLKKLTGYCLLSCVSFCFFITLFHTVVNAQTPDKEITGPSTDVAQSAPTPTLYEQQNPTPQPFFGQTYPTATPTPSPLPTATPAPKVIPSGNDLESLFTRFSEEYHVDRSLLRKIAACESGFRADAQNGIYLGMYQFAPETWITNRGRMGLDTNPDLRTNAEEAIRTAAAMLARGQQNAWANCL